MADIIYIGEFTDDAGNDCTVNIHKIGYDGEAATITMGSNPVVIKTIGTDDDKFQHITPTEAYIEVVSSQFLQFVQLFTSTQKTYYVEIFRGTNRVWIGWVNPEYYTEAFVTYPHTVTLHAVDGLAELKNILLPLPADFKNNALYYFVNCLSQIGLTSPNRNIHAAINLVALKYDDSLISSRILEAMYFDYRAFQDEEGIMLSCYDVLNEILSAINARLYQDDFHWHIERVDHRYEDYTVEYYSIGLGTYIGNSTENDVVELTANLGWGDTIRFEHSANLEIQPAAKKFTIEQPYGLRENMINGISSVLFKDGDFDESTGYLKYWTFYNGTVNHVKDEVIDDCLRIKGIYTGSINRLMALVEVQNLGVDNINTFFQAWKAGRLTLVLTYDVAKRFINKDSSKTFNASVTLYGNFSGNIYRLKDRDVQSFTVLGQRTSSRYGLTVHSTNNGSEGIFEPTSGLDNITIDLVEKDDFVTVNYKVAAPPDEELGNSQTYLQFIIELLPCITNLTDAQVAPTDGLLYKNMRLFFQENFTESYSRNIETIVNTDNVLEPSAYEVKFGNTPDNANCNAWGVLHKSVIFDSNGKVLRKWGIAPDSLPVSDLTETILMTDLFETYKKPQYLIKGTLINTAIDGDANQGMMLKSILKDYDGRYYMPLNVSYNMRSCSFESDWLCILDNTIGEFNDDFGDDFFN